MFSNLIVEEMTQLLLELKRNDVFVSPSSPSSLSDITHRRTFNPKMLRSQHLFTISIALQGSSRMRGSIVSRCNPAFAVRAGLAGAEASNSIRWSSSARPPFPPSRPDVKETPTPPAAAADDTVKGRLAVITEANAPHCPSLRKMRGLFVQC
jgi:hypothetical protein